MIWGSFTGDYTLPSGTRSIDYTMLFFRGDNGGTYIDSFIDDNSLTLTAASVPEPSSYAMLTGMLVLALVPIQRRR